MNEIPALAFHLLSFILWWLHAERISIKRLAIQISEDSACWPRRARCIAFMWVMTCQGGLCSVVL